MRVSTRWLLLRVGAHRVAAPMAQVRGLRAETAPVPNATVALARLWNEPDADDGLVVEVLVGTERRGVRVSAAEEVIETGEVHPFPTLLGRCLGPESPLLGLLLYQERPVVAVDLGRAAGCLPEGGRK